MEFSHFILTRFNVKKLFGVMDKNGLEVLTDNWMRHRFDLFEKYCLPSIDNQKNKNFIWLVYFDIDTNEYFMNKINILREKHSYFHPIFVDDFSHLSNTFKEDISNCIVEPINYLIATIIDNDDCLHHAAIQMIQNEFKGQSFEFINFP